MTIKAGLGSIAAAAAEEALSYLFLKDHYSAPTWRVNIKVRTEARFYLGISFLTTSPLFITNLTRLSSPMSLSGSPATAIRSANFALYIPFYNLYRTAARHRSRACSPWRRLSLSLRFHSREALRLPSVSESV